MKISESVAENLYLKTLETYIIERKSNDIKRMYCFIQFYILIYIIRLIGRMDDFRKFYESKIAK